MTPEMQTLLHWLQACLIIASVCTTSFPILYAFSPWYRSVLGRALMIQAIAFALVLDVTVIFQFWRPASILAMFWIEAILFTFIAGATAFLTTRLWQINYRTRKNQENNRGRRDTDR